MGNNLFRKEAMDEATSPDDLDQIISITSRKTHLLVIGMVILIVAGALWSLYGSVPVTIQGSGIIIPEGGIHYITPQQEGVIESIFIEQGQYFSAGEIVGKIEVKDENGNSKSFEITATTNGRVSEVRALQGDFVHSDEKIISFFAATETQDALSAIIFVPAEVGESLKPGVVVHVDPTYVNKEEYGFIKGEVKQVSDYPVSQQRMLELVGTEALMSYFSDGKVVMEVEVNLSKSYSTVSGYEWSTPQGPPFSIYEGTLCYADFIVETSRPIDLVIPGF